MAMRLLRGALVGGESASWCEMSVNIHRYRWKELLEISNESSDRRYGSTKMVLNSGGGGGGRGGGMRGLGKFLPPPFQQTSEKFPDLRSYNFARFLSIPLTKRKGLRLF